MAVQANIGVVFEESSFLAGFGDIRSFALWCLWCLEGVEWGHGFADELVQPIAHKF